MNIFKAQQARKLACCALIVIFRSAYLFTKQRNDSVDTTRNDGNKFIFVLLMDLRVMMKLWQPVAVNLKRRKGLCSSMNENKDDEVKSWRSNDNGKISIIMQTALNGLTYTSLKSVDNTLASVFTSKVLISVLYSARSRSLEENKDLGNVVRTMPYIQHARTFLRLTSRYQIATGNSFLQ